MATVRLTISPPSRAPVGRTQRFQREPTTPQLSLTVSARPANDSPATPGIFTLFATIGRTSPLGYTTFGRLQKSNPDAAARRYSPTPESDDVTDVKRSTPGGKVPAPAAAILPSTSGGSGRLIPSMPGYRQLHTSSASSTPRSCVYNVRLNTPPIAKHTSRAIHLSTATPHKRRIFGRIHPVAHHTSPPRAASRPLCVVPL